MENYESGSNLFLVNCGESMKWINKASVLRIQDKINKKKKIQFNTVAVKLSPFIQKIAIYSISSIRTR